MAETAPQTLRLTRLAPVWEPPHTLIAAMVAAGAQKEELAGEDLRIMRIESLDSDAWDLYRSWACSVGDAAAPLVMAMVAPTAEVDALGLSPPDAVGIDIQMEANSVINHMAFVFIADVRAGGAGAIPGPLDDPLYSVNVKDAAVAVTTLVETISNPGAKYPFIHALDIGSYVCHVSYVWLGATFVVPVFRKGIHFRK